MFKITGMQLTNMYDMEVCLNMGIPQNEPIHSHFAQFDEEIMTISP